MVWTTPRTWVIGEVPTASIFNEEISERWLELENNAASTNGAFISFRHGFSGPSYLDTKYPTWYQSGDLTLTNPDNERLYMDILAFRAPPSGRYKAGGRIQVTDPTDGTGRAGISIAEHDGVSMQYYDVISTTDNLPIRQMGTSATGGFSNLYLSVWVDPGVSALFSNLSVFMHLPGSASR